MQKLNWKQLQQIEISFLTRIFLLVTCVEVTSLKTDKKISFYFFTFSFESNKPFPEFISLTETIHIVKAVNSVILYFCSVTLFF